MLHYAVVFFVIAVFAALLGFSGMAAGAATAGRVLFVLFSILAAGALICGLLRGNSGNV